ncbi:MAG: ATP-binding protein [Blastochloris sp.]|nr:ATP-binding protein [Blastochloris sp.]
MKSKTKPRKILWMAQYLDALLFWSVFTSASVLMVWLQASTTKNLLRESVAIRIVTLSNMTAATLSPNAYVEGTTQRNQLIAKIPWDLLQIIQDENPEILGIAVIDSSEPEFNILGRTKTSLMTRKAIEQNIGDESFKVLLKQTQEKSGSAVSTWNFLAESSAPLLTLDGNNIEYTLTPISGWASETREDVPVILIAFNASLIRQQFLKVDTNSASVMSIALLTATVLSWLVHKRSIQKQMAVEGKLAAVTLLKQRDTILKNVVSTMDIVLAEKEFEKAISELLIEIGKELNLAYCYICLSPLSHSSAPSNKLASSIGENQDPITWQEFEFLWGTEGAEKLMEGEVFTLPSTVTINFHNKIKNLHDIQSLALIPILISKRLLGVMVLADREARSSWDPGLLDSLKFAADLYATAYGRREHDDKLFESSKVQILGKMAGGVAHEFNNLLHIISGNLDRVLKEGRLSESDSGLITKILEAGSRGSKIIAQLLSTTRQTRSDIKSESLNELVQKTMELFKSVLKKDIQLILRLDEHLPRALFDYSELQQVMLNLLLNANDAIIQQGRITILTSTKQRIVDNCLRTYVVCEVSDNGTGVAEKDVPLLFDPFFTTKEPGKGTGLGLSTSKGILSQHNGFIEVSNNSSGGASFTFYLPVVEASDFSIDGALKVFPFKKLPTSKGHVLIADDEPLCLELLTAILEDGGYSYESVTNGTALLDLAQRTDKEILWVVTDWTMPGINGKILMQQIKKHLPHTRIIVTSGFALDSLELPEVHALIQKPFRPDQLLSAMAVDVA